MPEKREFKFRWFNPIDKVFVYSSEYDSLFDFIGDFEFAKEENQIKTQLEQWIGAKDCLKLDVYEGDILNCADEPEEDSFCVTFEDGAFRKRYVDWDDTLEKPIVNQSEIDLMRYVVIGNVHQNKQRLRGGNE